MARYGYDILGRRIARVVYSDTTGGTVAYTRYVYRGGQVAYEADAAGTLGWSYVWGLGTDRLVAARDPLGTMYDAVTDQLGSVRGWFIPSSDGVVGTQLFKPYGKPIVLDTLHGEPFPAYGWTGREYDAETGFYYLRARYYDPFEYRFVQEDPAGYDGGSNLYAYVEGQVLSATDPSGMSPTPDGAFKMDGYIWAGNLWVYAQDDVRLPEDDWALLDDRSSVILTHESSLLIDGQPCGSPDAPKCSLYQEIVNSIQAKAYAALATIGDIGNDIVHALGSASREAAKQLALFWVTDGVGNAVATITEADVAIDGLESLSATMTMDGSEAVIYVSNVEGKFTSYTQFFSELGAQARAAGATSVRIGGTLANEQLENVMMNRLGGWVVGNQNWVRFSLP